MLAVRWVAASVVTLFMIVVGGGETPSVVSPTPSPVVNSATAPTPSSSLVETTTTTTTVVEVVEQHVEPRYDIPRLDGIENALCPDWWQLAVEVGWSEDQLSTLDRVMWNETRCQHNLVSSTNDWGLVQINRKVWEPTVIANGWSMEDLLLPHIALQMGLIVFNAAEEAGWCGWQPWFMSGSYCR